MDVPSPTAIEAASPPICIPNMPPPPLNMPPKNVAEAGAATIAIAARPNPATTFPAELLKKLPTPFTTPDTARPIDLPTPEIALPIALKKAPIKTGSITNTSLSEKGRQREFNSSSD